MSKKKADSNWNGLTAEQREMLEGWLFVENVGYAEAQERAARLLGVKASISSVGRYYRGRLKTRTVEEIEELQKTADAVNGATARMESLRSSAIKVISKRLLEMAMEGADASELAALGRLMTECEEREIQRARLALARERFEFNAAEAALAELPRLSGMTAEDIAREEERILAIKRRLFGRDEPA